MGRQRGLCPTCGGPIWRPTESRSWDGFSEEAEPGQSYAPKGNECRLCWLITLPTWCAFMAVSDREEERDRRMERWRELDIERGIVSGHWRGWRLSIFGGEDTPDRSAEANSTADSAATCRSLVHVSRGQEPSTVVADVAPEDAAHEQAIDAARYEYWLSMRANPAISTWRPIFSRTLPG